MTKTLATAPLPKLLVCNLDTDQEELARDWIGQAESTTNTSVQSSQLAPPVDIIWTNQLRESIKIAQIRSVLTQLQFAPIKGQLRYWVLLHADKLTLPAQNAILKVLEDTPNQTQILLLSSRPSQLLSTIHSRCQLIYTEKMMTEPKLDPAIQTLYQGLSNASASEIFQLSQKYKEREQALELVTKLILVAHDNFCLSPESISATAQHLTWLLSAQDMLEKNVNVRQVLEHTFFKISGIIKE